MIRFEGGKHPRNKTMWLVKAAACLVLAVMLFQFLHYDRFDSFYNTETIEYYNKSEQVTADPHVTEVRQSFAAKGNSLPYVLIYFEEIGGEELTFRIEDENGNHLVSKVVDPGEYRADSWNRVFLNCQKLREDAKYDLVIQSDSSLDILRFTDGSEGSDFSVTESGGKPLNAVLSVGFSFQTQDMSLQRAAEAAVNLVFAVSIYALLCYSILNFEKLYRYFLTSDKKTGLLYALFVSATLMQMSNPLSADKIKIVEFNRAIGEGIVHGIDVSRRISSFSMWFVLFAVTFGLLYLFFNNILQKKDTSETVRVKAFLDNAIIIACIALVLRGITFFQDGGNVFSAFRYSYSLMILVIALAFAYMLLKLERKISLQTYFQLMIAVLCGAFPVLSIGKCLFETQFVLCALALLVICTSKELFSKKVVTSFISWIVVPLSLIPFLTSCYIEFINILNQYSVFVGHPFRYYVLGMALWLVISGAVCMVLARKQRYLSRWKAWVYPILVVGFLCLSVQIWLESYYWVDIFETSNQGTLISDFLNFGKIPIVEHYGGHMLSGVLEGILYYFLNNRDMVGAIVSPYAIYETVIEGLLLYYMVKYVWDEDAALLTVLLLPLSNFWGYFAMGTMICFAVIHYIRKNTYPRAVLLWFVCIWLLLNRLDCGTAFVIASVLALTIYTVQTRNWKAAKQLLITLAGWLAAGLTAWCVICFAKHIHPVSRLLEFVYTSLSNQSWAYSGIGDSGMAVFSWHYLFIPALMIIGLTHVCCFPGFSKKIGMPRWIILLILGFSYFANFSRGIVRHSLVEMTSAVIIWSAYLFLAVWASCAANKRRLFLPIFAGFMLIGNLFLTKENFDNSPYMDSAIHNTSKLMEAWREDTDLDASGTPVTYWEKISQEQRRVTRTLYGYDVKNVVDKYSSVMNKLLDEDETYIDFANHTSVYSLIGREVPFYISQSPMQLSGEKMQEMFLEQIEGIPVVAMPAASQGGGLDGISTFYRYYKISEYIYQNYVPLAQYDSAFSLWCLPERYEEMSQKLTGRSYAEEAGALAALPTNNCVLTLKDGEMAARGVGEDPYILEMQRVLDMGEFDNVPCRISLEYTTDTDGVLQLFYTTEAGEYYSAEKSIAVDIAGSGTAEFEFTATKNSKIRLDIPDDSEVIIHDIHLSERIALIDYGYEAVGGDAAWHAYDLWFLPNIWAEKDKHSAVENPVVYVPEQAEEGYIIDQREFTPDPNGNYLHLQITYDGTNQDVNDEEVVEASVCLGQSGMNDAESVCQYRFLVYEGTHDYLIRVSSDYHWYLQDLNTISIECEESLHDLQVQILAGD